MHPALQTGKRTLFLEGIGGIGKSELARQYALRYKADYENILFVLTGRQIDVLTEDQDGTDLLEDQERLRIFYWRREAQKLCNILDEVLLERAKRINLRYASLYFNVPENDRTKETEWKKQRKNTSHNKKIFFF